MNIYYLINLIKRRLWLLIIIPIIGAAAAFMLLSSLPQKYRSSAQLATGFTTDETVKLNDEKFNVGKTTQDFNNLIEQMNSELVVTLVSYNLIIHDLTSDIPFRTVDYATSELKKPTPEEKQEMVKVYKEKLQSMKLLSSFDPKELKLLEYLKAYRYNSFSLKEKGLDIGRVKNSDFISVEFVSEDPALSAYVVNTLCGEFIRYNRNLKSSLSDESVSLLAKLVQEKKEALDKRTTELNEFKSSNQVLNQRLENDIKLTQIAEYEGKKSVEEDNIRALRLSIAQTRDRIRRANNNKGGANNTKVLQLRENINKLNQLYIDGGSNDPELEKSIADLRNELQIEMTRLGTEASLLDEAKLQEQLDNYELQLGIAQSSLAGINSTLGRLRSQIAGHNTKESTLDGLTKEVELASKEYNQALDKYNEYKNRSLILGSSLRLIKEGQPALEPESSHTLVITALAGASSFALCVVFIVLMEFIDFRIKTSDNFRKVTKLKLAGTINKIPTKNLKLNDIFNEYSQNADLIVFKQLLRKVRFELESTGGHSVLVTSTKPGEGKTFFILCLAYSLSLIKKKVLIIDTNFKNNGLTKLLLVKPNFHRLLEEGDTKRRTNHLLNAATNEPVQEGQEPPKEPDMDQEFSRKIIYPTGHKNIDIIGSNPSTNSPMEILAGRDFKKMLKTFEQNYDYILMEGASLNDFPDTKELVEYADLVLPIFSAESTIKQVDKESISYLKSLDGRLMGSVLNKVENENLKI
ncbi:hypothetical protein C900_01986 [Fulvivirga imtechensis AK7]|uniref:Uncharacterized protein n=1 Tax=Fulvivirga imtechensis AK7 TaxID=1237149 RepID=L8JSP5_9BACT|nr:AAA family ATPase [Fulvivirga imtechensis]ELR71991.1 hypothetical protein C900_01986 [Fulvivirga imtechensis AK7]